MKKQFLSFIIIAASVVGAKAQTEQKWTTNGNAISGSDVIGTSNNNPLIFIVNGSQVARFKQSGDFKINNLKANNNRMLFADTSGILTALPQGNSSQVLFGNGAWGDLPNIFWRSVSHGIAIPDPNLWVGIGNNNPQYNLDVTGDIRATNNIYVGGGVLVSDKVYANSSLKTDTVTSSSGKTTFTSPVKLKFQFEVDGNSIFNAPTLVNSNLNVTGSATFGSAINIGQNLNVSGNASILGILSTNTLNVSALKLAGGDLGIGYIPASGSSGPILLFGNQTPPSVQGVSCFTGASSIVNMFGDQIQIYNNWGSSTPGKRVLSVGTDYSGASIDLAGQADNSTDPDGVLLMNYYCGKDVAICTGGFGSTPQNTGGSNSKGGVVSMGQNVQIGNPTFDFNTALNIKTNGTYGLKIADVSNGHLVKINNTGQILFGTDIYHGLAAFDIDGLSTKFANTPINGPVLFGYQGGALGSTNPSNGGQKVALQWNDNGQVYIGGRKPNGSNPHINAKLAVYGDIVSTAIYVTDPSLTWADFVFDKNYKLMPLPEVENFYKQKHHLPSVPTTKDIQENGNDLARTDAILLQKIEELTLYLVEQNKIIEKLQKENKEIKELIKK